MNPASWVILALVVVIVGFAVKATFFKKKSKGGCCDVGDEHAAGSCCEPTQPRGLVNAQPCPADEREEKLASGACGNCTACANSATARNAVMPIVKPAV